MEIVLLKRLFAEDFLDMKVRVCGLVRTVRKNKKFSFVEISDGSVFSTLQVVIDCGITSYKDIMDNLSTGASVDIVGKVVESPGKGQSIELSAEFVKITGKSPADYPLQKKRHTFEFLRSIAHLRPRTNAIGAVMHVRSRLAYAVHNFFQDHDFFYVHTPIVTVSDCEGAGEMFKVTTLDLENLPLDDEGKVDYSEDFFGKPTSLTVSGQLNGEAYASALGRIYTFGPTFRAENSHTPRHLAEFWMIEPEASFFDLSDDMNLAEDFVRFLAKDILENNFDDLEFFNFRVESTVIETLETIAENSFERISYTDAIGILEKNNSNFDYKVKWGSDIQTEHERYLTETVFKKPVIVFDYPKDIKAFYMKQNNDGKSVKAMDLLVPRIGELIGGSERENDYDRLLDRIDELGLDKENYSWYLDLRKFGSVPHSGFGLGFERMILLVTGMQNIRDVIPFPRYPGNAEF